MEIKIEGRTITAEEIDRWRYSRVKNAFSLLKEKREIPSDTAQAMLLLTNVKEELGGEEILKRLRTKLALNTAAVKLFTRLSGGKRKFAKTEIRADGITAEKASRWVNEINLNAGFDRQYTRVNLAACPDHFILRCTGEKTLEVIECNGNYPTPFRFFITYGDETGLKTPGDPSFPYQSVGAARTEDGVVIGGVRHQFQDTETGFMVRLCVEFPSMTPGFVVRTHQIHLAAEFSYWLQWIIDHKGKEST